METVPYTSAAAGHEGISTSADGTLLIKPCTKAEIDFYESAKDHPAFQAHMPVYMGHLSQASPELQSQASLLQQQQTSNAAPASLAPPASPFAVVAAAAKISANSHKRSASGHITSEPLIARSATKEWTPSGGAKLNSQLSIVLSNATAGFVRPNVIDLKLGARLWDDDAPAAKRKKLDDVAATSTSGRLGFRVAGMKVYVGNDAKVEREVNTEFADGFKTYNKFYGRDSITDQNVGSAFESFLYSLSLAPDSAKDDAQWQRKLLLRRKILVERFLREMSSIEYVLENEESRMYSASVLMVYEGDPDALEGVVRYKEENSVLVSAEGVEQPEDDEENDEEDEEVDDDEPPKQKIHEVVMIDFAHAHWTPGQGSDENMLKGVRSIVKILEGLLGDTEGELK